MTTFSFGGARTRDRVSIPILEFPAFQFPRRQRLHPPLFPAIRRPVAEARGFLDRREVGDARQLAPALARCLADHIDEFRLVGHGALPSRKGSFRKRPVCPRHLNEAFPERLAVEASRVKVSGFDAFSTADKSTQSA